MDNIFKGYFELLLIIESINSSALAGEEWAVDLLKLKEDDPKAYMLRICKLYHRGELPNER